MVRATRDGPGSGALSVRLPSGRILSLAPGREAEFTADPSQYYLAFGRSRNAAERAALVARILGGAPPPADPAAMTPAELEAFLRDCEMRYAPRAR